MSVSIGPTFWVNMGMTFSRTLRVERQVSESAKDCWVISRQQKPVEVEDCGIGGWRLSVKTRVHAMLASKNIRWVSEISHAFSLFT
jgi:hypothetical protein